MKDIKRFAVRNDSNGLLDLEVDTTDEVYKWLCDKDLGAESYHIECRVDDIKIHSDEFSEAFETGECPGDLQFF